MYFRNLFTGLAGILCSTAIFAGAPPQAAQTVSEPQLMIPSQHWHLLLGMGADLSRADTDVRGLIYEPNFNILPTTERQLAVMDADAGLGINAHVGLQFAENFALMMDYNRWHHTDDLNHQLNDSNLVVISYDNIDTIAKHISAKINFHLDTIDLYLTQALPVHGNIVSHILVGGKWLRLTADKTREYAHFEDLHTHEEVEGFYRVSENSEFNGFGPLIGIAGRYPLFGHELKLGVFGQTTCSILIDDVKSGGDFNFEYEDFESLYDIESKTNADFDSRMTYNAHFKLGFEVTRATASVEYRVSTGVDMDYYYNIIRMGTGSSIDSDFRKKGIFVDFSVSL